MSDSLPPSAQGDDSLDPTRLGPASPSPPPGHGQPPADRQDFEGYQIISELSRGGQGIVYEAIQRSTKRRVAIKLLLAGVQANDEARRRFQREIELLAQLRHPHIVSIFAADVTRDGRQYYVMDFVRGVPLDKYVASRQLGLHDVLVLFATICDAVQHAHGHGIIHRDLKPQNILVDFEGQPRVLDFGLARPLALTGDAALSISQAVVGTVPYMAPEQAAGETSRVDARTDVYGLGVTLYRVITNEFPYDVCGSLHQVLHNIRYAQPKRPHLSGRPINAEVETILLKCLAKERSRRYQTAGELAADVRAYLAGSPISARRDSISYLARKRTRGWLKQNPFAMSASVVIAAIVLTMFVGEPLIFRWTRMNHAFEDVLTRILPGAAAMSKLHHVLVGALTDQTDIAGIAAREAIEGVTPEERRSLRRLYGRLMEKLVGTGVRAVVWDLTFMGESPFDDDFARGARALRESGVGVIVCVTIWPLEGIRSSELSRTIASEVKWGRPAASLTAESPWRLVLFMQRGNAEPVPSLALAAVGVVRQPEAIAMILIDSSDESVLLQYWKPDEHVSSNRIWLEATDRIRLSALWHVDQPTRTMDLLPGDVSGYYILNMPTDEILTDAVMDLNAIFSASRDELVDKLNGKVLVIGDLRGETDRHPHPDGRRLPGCFAHAVGIEQLLTSTSIGRLNIQERSIVNILAAVCGLIIVAGTKGKLKWRVLLGVAALATALIACLTTTRFFGLFWNPLPPVFALLAAILIGSWWRSRASHETTV